MRLAIVGVGQAGGKLTDAFLDYDLQTNSNIVVDAMAVNTAKADLLGLSTLPEDKRVCIGEADVKGQGVGADNELGAKIAEQDIDELLRVLDTIPTHKIDAFLVVAALGGGTGSGGAPVIAKHLKRIYDEPVYGLGVLPGTDEGSIYTLNAARSFQTFVREVDNLLVFDNDAWRHADESMGDAWAEINAEITRQFGAVFGAGEFDAGDHVAESVVDASEVINTLSNGGVSTIGYAADELDMDTAPSGGLLNRLRGKSAPAPDDTHVMNRITSLTRKAALGRLTLPCEVSSTERALVVVSGPPAYLNRKGIERARTWIEDETDCMEVRGGDNPQPGSATVSSVVLMSGITDVPRIKQLQQIAIEAQGRTEELAAERETNLDDLVTSGDGGSDLEPLF